MGGDKASFTKIGENEMQTIPMMRLALGFITGKGKVSEPEFIELSDCQNLYQKANVAFIILLIHKFCEFRFRQSSINCIFAAQIYFT